MTVLLAIDPGVSTGCAVFRDGELADAWNGEPKVAWFDRVVIELPQVYTSRLMKGDPNDLITLAVRVGRYTERLTPHAGALEHVKPATWKGQVPKDIHHNRMIKRLGVAEAYLLASVLEPMAEKPREDVCDAVALGLWALGRLRKSGAG